MRHFKTILLWLAFVLLVSQVWIDFENNPLEGFIYRIIPSLCLLIWFFLSLFFKQALKINAAEIPQWALLTLKVFRPIASGLIVLGALFKLMHWPYANFLLITGIGCMAIYSTILNHYAYLKSEKSNDIIDN